MTALNKQALREAADKALPAMKRLLMMPNDELFDEALLNVDGDVDAANAFNLLTGPETVLALVEALESGDIENERMARDLISRNGEIEGLRKRVEELEEVATDYGMKFQRAQDDLKKMALMHSDESCPVTVKLPDERFRYGESDYDDGYVNGWNAHGIEVKRLLADAGIQVIEGEGQ